MMDSAFVAYFVGFVLLAIFGYAVSGTPGRVSENSGYLVAEFSTIVRLTSAVAVLLFAAMAIATPILHPDAIDVAMFVALVAVIGGGYFVLDVCRTRIEFCEENFVVWAALKRRKKWPWSAVKRLRYSDWLMGYVVEMSDGEKVRVSDWLSGGDQFVDHARRWARYNEKHGGG